MTCQNSFSFPICWLTGAIRLTAGCCVVESAGAIPLNLASQNYNHQIISRHVQSKFFQQINYSSSTEDSAAECLALNLTPSDHVVCITGSGSRTLDLLLQRPAKIDSVDFNLAQNCLFRLKIAAYQVLEYPDFCTFLGLEEFVSSSRMSRQSIYASLAPQLSSETRAFWDQKTSLIDRGILYCGTWEKLLRVLSKTTVLRRRKVDQLLNAESLSEQISCWEQHWSGFFFKTYLKLLSNRFLWTNIVREPGARLIPPEFDVAGYLHRRLEMMAKHSMMRENPYANLLFHGRYQPGCELPPHLQEGNFEIIKEQIHRVQIIDEDIESFLTRHTSQFDAYSLSDFSSYAPLDTYQAVWKAVGKSAKSSARFCERQFLVKRELSQECLERDGDLEQRLEELDHTCLYSFSAGSVSKN